MERKTMLQVLPEKWAIQRTKDNYKMVNEWANKVTGKDNHACSDDWVHSENIDDSNSPSCGEKKKDYTKISTVEFKVLVLGEKLKVSDLKENECIHVATEEEDRQIRELLHSAGKNWCNGFSYNNEFNNNPWKTYGNKGIYLVSEDMQGSLNYAEENNYTIYPASYFITNNDTTMNKEIIGYVLKPEYHNMQKACESITGFDYNFIIGKNNAGTEYAVNNINGGTMCYTNLEEAGVLNLWFQPVYKEEKKYSTGDWVTIVKAEEGAYGADGRTGQIVDKEFTSGKKGGPSIQIGNQIWQVGTSAEIRLATKEEIEAATTKVLTLGDKNIRITIRKGSIEAEGQKVPVMDLRQLQGKLSGNYRVANWAASIPSVKIGCCTFTKEEINQIITTYDNLNK